MEQTTQGMIEGQQLRALVPGIRYISADYSMKAGDKNIVADSSSGAVVLTLPSKAEAIGGFYYIEAPSGASNDVSVFDKESGSEISDGDMDADDDHLILYCSGRLWRTVLDGVA